MVEVISELKVGITKKDLATGHLHAKAAYGYN